MLLIVGRTCTGKDTLVHELKKKGLKSVKSYTTRPRRYEGEDTHIFITPEVSAMIKDKVATTVINGYEYFATKSQVKEWDIYIIDPKGMWELIRNCPDEKFKVVYVTADKLQSLVSAVKRSSNPDEASVFYRRSASENDQFTDFERMSDTSDYIANNCQIVYRYRNDFTDRALQKAVKGILGDLI